MNTIFFYWLVLAYKQWEDEHGIWHPRTLVCFCHFDAVFIFIVNLYKFQYVFISIPANIVTWLQKIILMPNYWSSRSVLRWMSVSRNREIRNMVLPSTFGLIPFTFFVVFCAYDLKTYCIVDLYTQTSQIDCFRRVHKILLWIVSSDFK